MTINEAATGKISRLRLPEWSPDTYIKLELPALLSSGTCIVWLELFDRIAQEVLGEDIPQYVFSMGSEFVEFDYYEAYTGQLDRNDK